MPMGMGKVNHYTVLGLPDGQEGAKLTQKDISKAYRLKALGAHPDKPKGDDAKFLEIKESYDFLMDACSPNCNHLNYKVSVKRRQKKRPRPNSDMVSDLDVQRAKVRKQKAEEMDRIVRQLVEEIATIRAKYRATQSMVGNVPESYSFI